MPDSKKEIKKALDKVGASSPSTVPTEPTSTAEDDPCKQLPGSSTDTCNMLATTEGNGSYTQDGPSWSSAKGRYQIVTGTAVDQIMKIKKVKNKTEAKALWMGCRQSSTSECKKLQDDICANYSKEQANSLRNHGHALTTTNRYLAWNQGAGGANAILRSAASGQPVTNPDILNNMKNQGWAFSSDGATYIKNMQGYMAKKGTVLT